jgi:DNA-3-methyladenine glycosylase
MTRASNAALPARRSRLGRPFTPDFYDRDTAAVARDLLGAILESTCDGVITRGRIVEVEAYLGPHDPACHAAAGCTPRNRHLHGPPGTAYVYRIYGMHWCVNAVTREVGHGSAVLVRALAPLHGLESMRGRRGIAGAAVTGPVAGRGLANGPGKLCQALGITGALDGTPLQAGLLRLLPGERAQDAAIVVTPRIGISRAADWPLRFLIDGDPHVSATPRHFQRWRLDEADAWRRARGVR